MTEELKIVLEMFATLTDGALVGGSIYLVLDTVKFLFPWVVGWVVGVKLIGKIPQLGIRRKKGD